MTFVLGGARGRRAAAVLALVVLFAGLAACGDDGGGDSAGGSAPAEPKRGGTLRYAPQAEVISWKPWDLRQTTSGEDRGMLIYDTLVRQDVASGKYVANLAESMESTDGITWTLKLRSGVRFTDGTALDAEAVKFNVEQHQVPANASPLIANVAGVASMTVVDPLALRFVLKEVDGNFPYAFTTLPGQIISPTAYKADPTAFGTKPVGAGPFMVQSWVKDATLSLVRNPTYWDAPRPYVDAIDVRLIVDDTTRGQALAAGDVDLAANDPPVASAVKGNNRYKVHAFNDNGVQTIIPNQSKAPGNDVRIREAIAIAFDPKLVNDSLLQGTGTGQPFSCPPYTDAMAECVKGIWPKPDAARAKKLVSDYKAAGNTLGTYVLLIHTSIIPNGELIQQVLRDIGIDTKIEAYPVSEYVTRTNQGNFDFAWSGTVPFDGPANSFFRNVNSKELFRQKGTPNLDLDKATNDARRALSAEARVEAAKEVQRINAKDFIQIAFAPYAQGLIGKTDVELGDRYTGGTVFFGADVWLNR